MAELNGSKSEGTCDACPNVGTLTYMYSKLHLCSECESKELQSVMAANEAHQTEDKQNERLAAHKNVENVTLMHVRQENAALRVSTDIFNAKIKSITELKKAIDSDETIPNKNFALAQVLGERFAHLTTLIHGNREVLAQQENEQRAIQSYYNDLSKQLHHEEREKIKLADLEYKPEVRITKAVPEEKPKVKLNYDKTGIAAFELLTGIPAALIQLTCVSKNVTPEMAVKLLKEQGLKDKRDAT